MGKIIDEYIEIVEDTNSVEDFFVEDKEKLRFNVVHLFSMNIFNLFMKVRDELVELGQEPPSTEELGAGLANAMYGIFLYDKEAEEE